MTNKQALKSAIKNKMHEIECIALEMADDIVEESCDFANAMELIEVATLVYEKERKNELKTKAT